MKILCPAALGQGVRLASLGVAAGAQVIDNVELVALGYPGDPDEIQRLTGISERRHLASDESLMMLAVRACQQALPVLDALDGLIVSSSSPPRLIPSMGSDLHGRLGITDAPAHTISAACSGFLFGLDLAVRGVLTGAKQMLVCAAEARAQQVEITDRATGALFGDAAAAAVLEPCMPSEGILAIGITSQASPVDTVTLDCDGRLQMQDGARVYFEAVEGMKRVGETLLAHLDLTWDQVDLVIPHQANGRILKRLCWLTKLPPEKAYSNLGQIGNTSSASIPFALHQAIIEGRVRAGARVLFVAVGAGYTAGAALIQIDKALIQTVRNHHERD